MAIEVRKYRHFTPDELAYVKTHYKHTQASVEEIAAELSRRRGEEIPASIIRSLIWRKGYGNRKVAWSEKEIEKLKGMATREPVETIARQLRRSENSVRQQMCLLGISTRIRDGWFTARDVADILGISHTTVLRCIETGDLKARRRHSHAWEIKTKDLAAYIRTHATEFEGRNVDLFTIVGILTGDIE